MLLKIYTDKTFSSDALIVRRTTNRSDRPSGTNRLSFRTNRLSRQTVRRSDEPVTVRLDERRREFLKPYSFLYEREEEAT